MFCENMLEKETISTVCSEFRRLYSVNNLLVCLSVPPRRFLHLCFITFESLSANKVVVRPHFILGILTMPPYAFLRELKKQS